MPIRGRVFNRSGRFRAPDAFGGRMSPMLEIQPDAQPSPLPICTGGWNTVAPLTGAPPDSAIILDNWFPEASYIEMRRGFAEHCDTAEGAFPVESLMPYHGVTTASDALFAAVNGSIYDVTTDTPSQDVTSLTNDRWQYTQYANSAGNFLVIANGADAVRNYNGATWSTPSLSGVTSADLVDVTSHLGRLWFVEVNSTNAWFMLQAGAIAGTLAPFPLGGIFKEGGYLVTIAPWRIEGEGGDNDMLVFISSRGECVVYAGTDPTSASTWRKVGTFLVGPPIGRRCFLQLGSDLGLISIDGVLPLSQALLTERSAAPRIALSENIRPTMAAAARSYMTNFGWQLTSYPAGTRAILNVPVTEGSEQHQYVMNTVTGAWCRFTAQNANVWTIWKDRLFFGGNDGRVMEGDISGNDDGSAIVADMQTAFHNIGNRGVIKHFPMIRPIFTSSSGISPSIGLNIDYEVNVVVDDPLPAVETGALWDAAIWDSDLWGEDSVLIKEWQSTAAAPGNAVSIRLKASVNLNSTNPVTRLNSLDIIARAGGLI